MSIPPFTSSTPPATLTLPGKSRKALYNPLDYGAVGNANQVTDGSMSSSVSPTTLTSASAGFTAADVGKSVGVQGAGAAGTDLTTTISALISYTQVTLSVGASTTVSGATTLYGTDDTSAFNTMLTAINTATGGWAFVPGFNYLISAPLVIYTNTKLQLAPDAALYLQLNSACQMLIDSAHNAGILTVPSPIKNIEVSGGNWFRGHNGGATGLLQVNIILGGSNTYVHDLVGTSALGKYFILLQNCRDFCVERIYLPDWYSDGVHIQGPTSNGTVRDIKGVTHDDFCAVVPNDYAGFTWGNEGDVTDIVFENLEPQIAYTVALKILSGSTNGGATPLNTKRITGRNITGVMANGNASCIVYIGDDGSIVNTSQGHIDDILIDGVCADFGSGHTNNSVVKIFGLSSGASLNIPKIILRNLQVVSDVGAVVDCSANVTSLIVDGVSGKTATLAMNGIIYSSQNFPNSILTRVFLSNVDITNAGTQGGAMVSASGSLVTLGEVYANNIMFNNFSFLASLAATTILRLSNVNGLVLGGRISAGSAAAVTLSMNQTSTLANNTDIITAGGSVVIQALSAVDPIGAVTSMPAGAYAGSTGSTGKVMLVGNTAGLIDVNLTSTNPQAGFRGRLFYSTASDYWMFGVNNAEIMRLTARGLGVISGASAQQAKTGGIIFDHFADAGNTHTDGVTFDDLYSDSILASTLNTNGDKLVADYSGTFVSSATANRDIRVQFAGNTILDTGALTTATAEAWDIDVFIIRESSTVVRCMAKVVSTTSLGAGVFNDITYTRITGLTLSGANILKIQAVSGSTGAAANDIVAKLGTVAWQSAA